MPALHRHMDQVFTNSSILKKALHGKAAGTPLPVNKGETLKSENFV